MNGRNDPRNSTDCKLKKKTDFVFETAVLLQVLPEGACAHNRRENKHQALTKIWVWWCVVWYCVLYDANMDERGRYDYCTSTLQIHTLSTTWYHKIFTWYSKWFEYCANFPTSSNSEINCCCMYTSLLVVGCSVSIVCRTWSVAGNVGYASTD